MQEENKNAKYVVYNDKKIPLSSLTFQTRQIMQRQSELQQEVAKLQMAINENQLLFAEGNAIKYICRHKKKGKKKDIEKAIHYLEMIIERDYS